MLQNTKIYPKTTRKNPYKLTASFSALSIKPCFDSKQALEKNFADEELPEESFKEESGCHSCDIAKPFRIGEVFKGNLFNNFKSHGSFIGSETNIKITRKSESHILSGILQKSESMIKNQKRPEYTLNIGNESYRFLGEQPINEEEAETIYNVVYGQNNVGNNKYKICSEWTMPEIYLLQWLICNYAVQKQKLVSTFVFFLIYLQLFIDN